MLIFNKIARGPLTFIPTLIVELQHFCILISSFVYLKLDPWALYSVA